MKKLRWAALSLFVVILLIGGTAPARAAVNVDYIVAFGANCRDFSVDLYFPGRTDDGNGVDRFRYLVVDGSGAVLYQEDAWRLVGEHGYDEAINLAYQNKPTVNPVSFILQDVDGAGKVIGDLERVRHDVDCLKPSGLAKLGSRIYIWYTVRMDIRQDAPLYDAPNGNIVGSVYTYEGVEAVYRTADNQWAAINLFGDDLFWVPSRALDALALLPIKPTRIERTPTVGQATGVYIRDYLSVHTQPTLDSTVRGIIGYIPNEYVQVLARTHDNQWFLVWYAGAPGWTVNGNVYLHMGDLHDLPFIQYPGQ